VFCYNITMENIEYRMDDMPTDAPADNAGTNTGEAPEAPATETPDTPTEGEATEATPEQ
jgi:hypothetical protein